VVTATEVVAGADYGDLSSVVRFSFHRRVQTHRLSEGADKGFLPLLYSHGSERRVLIPKGLAEPRESASGNERPFFSSLFQAVSSEIFLHTGYSPNACGVGKSADAAPKSGCATFFRRLCSRKPSNRLDRYVLEINLPPDLEENRVQFIHGRESVCIQRVIVKEQPP
jgi:hypothetical protein